MGVPMVKDVPLAVDLLYAAVVVAGGVQPVLGDSAVIADVAIADNNTAEPKIPVRVFRCGVAQLVVYKRGPNKIIGAIHAFPRACRTRRP